MINLGDGIGMIIFISSFLKFNYEFYLGFENELKFFGMLCICLYINILIMFIICMCICIFLIKIY